jgi:hypothetical protein
MTYADERPNVLRRDKVTFGMLTCILVVAAHAIAYMTHEYSHSFVAWALGWMPKPLALDYGRPTLSNILFLGDVSDNVQYDPILTSGHGWMAAIIALAGMVLGNGVLYALLYRLTKSSIVASGRIATSVVYWLGMMCAGNVWSYVPIRALTSHGDIAVAAKGLNLSTWALFPIVIIPALFVVHHFFWKMFPRCIGKLSAGSKLDRALIVALTAYWFFAFFGSAGADGSYGPVTQLLAITSKYLVFPLAVIWLTARSMIDSRQPVGPMDGSSVTAR